MDLLTRTRRRLATYLDDRRCRRLTERQTIAGQWRRLYLYHIRKTGGTSLIHSFLALSGMPGERAYERLKTDASLRLIANGKVFTGWDVARIEQGHYFFAFSHAPAHALTLPADTFTITCLRDPVERVLSHYKMLLHYQRNGIDHPCMATEGGWLGDSLEDFLDRIPSEHLLNQLAMFSPALDVDEALERLRAVNHVFFTERMGEGVAALSDRLGLLLRSTHVRKAEMVVEAPDATRVRMREMLAPEYRLIERSTVCSSSLCNL